MSGSTEENAVFTVCPRCGENTLRVDRPALNALSRSDNETYVCSQCGTVEALEDFVRGGQRASKEHWARPNG